MQEELVSVITASYNTAPFISQTIESVLHQSYQNWEMIIVDDRSSDNSTEVIRHFADADPRITLIVLEQNGGPAIARNKAIETARGRYLAFLDSDDLWHAHKLKTQIAFMQKNNYAFTYSYYDMIDEEGHSLHKSRIVPDKLSYRDMLKTNYIGCLSAIYDTKMLGKITMPLIRKRQDYGLWLRILKKVDFAYGYPEVLATYRVRSHSVSSNKINLLKYNYTLFKEHEQLSTLQSIYYLLWNIYIKIKG
jgi:glycosyltransferase involved in cell wall biosynthesis